MITDRVGVYEYVVQIYSDEYPNMFLEYPGPLAFEMSREHYSRLVA